MRLTRNQMKYAAYFTMLLDHIGWVLFPGVLWLRAVGRLAFPFFAYLLVEGVEKTSNKTKYALRLGGLALLSEPIFDLGHGKIVDFASQNIYFTLLLGAIACFLILKTKPQLGAASYLFVTPFFVLSWLMRVDYGTYGIFLIVGFLLAKEDFWEKVPFNRYLLVLLLGCFVTMLRNGSPLQNLSVIAGFFMPVKEAEERPLSKLWYFFYPVHFGISIGLSHIL